MTTAFTYGFRSCYCSIENGIAIHPAKWVLVASYAHMLIFMLLLKCPSLSLVTAGILLIFSNVSLPDSRFIGVSCDCVWVIYESLTSSCGKDQHGEFNMGRDTFPTA